MAVYKILKRGTASKMGRKQSTMLAKWKSGKPTSRAALVALCGGVVTSAEVGAFVNAMENQFPDVYDALGDLPAGKKGKRPAIVANDSDFADLLDDASDDASA